MAIADDVSARLEDLRTALQREQARHTETVRELTAQIAALTDLRREVVKPEVESVVSALRAQKFL